MACSHVGGLSGAFIPVSEDAGMIDAVLNGSLNLEKLEAMTCYLFSWIRYDSSSRGYNSRNFISNDS